jgi:hypothetical protein
MMSKIALSLSILALAFAARAETAEPVPNVENTTEAGPIANERPDDVAAQISDWVKEASQAPVDDVGAPGVDRPLDRRIHGEVGAAIGTGGYRSAYGVVNIPIGKTGSATIAASDTRYRTRWGGRGGGQSLSLGLDFSDAGRTYAPGQRCLTSPHGRYVDPMWVSRARRSELYCNDGPYGTP